MVEARFGRPRWNVRAAVVAKDFLEAGNDFSGARVARRDWTTGARIASLKIHFADPEAHGAALFFAEKMIFPERRNAVDFESGTETLARFVQAHAREQIADSLQACRRNNGWAIGDVIVGKAFV